MSAMKFNVGEPKKVTLSFDQPKIGTNDYGKWYMYGIKTDINGGDDSFFATYTLHTMIQNLGAKEGDEITVEKCQDGDAFFFKVNGLSMHDMNNAGSAEKIEEAKPKQEIGATDNATVVLELAKAKQEIKSLKNELEKFKANPISENDIPF